jgi:hypothetical protein
MLRRVGSRTEFTVGRKHRTIGQLRHSGTKLKFWQYRHAIGHNSDESRLDITKRDLSECDYPWLYIAQRDAEPRHAGIHHPRLDIAGFDHSRLDFAKRHSEYDDSGLDITEHDDSGIDFAQRHAEHDDSGIDFAQWHSEYNDSGIDFAQWDSEYNDPWIDFTTRHGSG